MPVAERTLTQVVWSPGDADGRGRNQGGRPSQGSPTATCWHSPHQSLLSLAPCTAQGHCHEPSTSRSRPAQQHVTQVPPSEGSSEYPFSLLPCSLPSLRHCSHSPGLARWPLHWPSAHVPPQRNSPPGPMGPVKPKRSLALPSQSPLLAAGLL